MIITVAITIIPNININTIWFKTSFIAGLRNET